MNNNNFTLRVTCDKIIQDSLYVTSINNSKHSHPPPTSQVINWITWYRVWVEGLFYGKANGWWWWFLDEILFMPHRSLVVNIFVLNSSLPLTIYVSYLTNLLYNLIQMYYWCAVYGIFYYESIILNLFGWYFIIQKRQIK